MIKISFVKIRAAIRSKLELKKLRGLHNSIQLEYYKSNYKEALRLSIKAKELTTKNFGEKNVYYFLTLIFESSALMELGRNKEAKNNIVQAEVLLTELNFEKGFEYFRMKLLQGKIEAGLQNFKIAEKYYLEAFSYFSKIENKSADYFEVVVNSIGMLYSLMGKTSEAQKYYSMSKT